MPTPEDIWYALANTEVILPPQKRLATFGDTIINYHLISEKMDAVNEVRIREGRVHAERPQLLTAAYFESLMLEGFDEKAQQYVDWLREHMRDLAFLKYGFRFRKEAMHESTLHENLATVIARVKSAVEERGDPLTVVLKGVDDAWEICLLKFVTDTIRQSAPQNVKELKQRKMFEQIGGVPRAIHEEVGEDFEAVGDDPAKMRALGEKLRRYGIFEPYEDRFYALVRRLPR